MYEGRMGRRYVHHKTTMIDASTGDDDPDVFLEVDPAMEMSSRNV